MNATSGDDQMLEFSDQKFAWEFNDGNDKTTKNVTLPAA
jgi:hypothetical protein